MGVKRATKLILLGALAAGLWVLLRGLLESDRSSSPASPETGEGAPAPAPPETGEGAPAPSGNGARVAGATKAELYERAKQLDVEGRSKMSKDELAEAVAAAERSG